MFSKVFRRCFLSNRIKNANTKAKNKLVKPIVQLIKPDIIVETISCIPVILFLICIKIGGKK